MRGHQSTRPLMLKHHQQHRGGAGNVFSGFPCQQFGVQIMNPDCGHVRAFPPSQYAARVGVHINQTSIAQAEFESEIVAGRYTQSARPGAGKRFANLGNHPIRAHTPRPGLDVPETGIQPVIHFGFHAHHGAGDPGNQQHRRAGEARVQAQLQ